jgi:hypothetical protein
MIYYRIIDIEGEIVEHIKGLVKNICRENKINYSRQEYKVLFSNENLFFSNNNVKFSSGAKAYLSLYGKLYPNKKNKIIEKIYLDEDTVEVEPTRSSLLILLGGIKNSTIVENDEEVLYFYVAPAKMLELQDSQNWQTL